jgi:fermentation-respiration switch protein FrsA (DUF1100 family)
MWEFLINKKKLSPDKIIIWGRSLGGAIATELALNNSPKALILESTFSSIPDMAKHLYPFLPTKFLCTIKYDSFSKIPKIACPKLFIHSRNDDIVPFKFGKKLFNNAKEPKEFIEISGNHNNGFIDSEDSYIHPIKTFIKNI